MTTPTRVDIETNSDKSSTVIGHLHHIDNLNQIPSSLFKWNLAATLVQFGQAAVLFYLSYKADTQWYLYTNFPLSFDERTEAPDEFGRPGPNEIGSFSVAWYSAVFILLSGIDHLVCCVFRRRYEYYIARHQNPFRWIEYAVSASLMRSMIAQLSGVTDIHLLWCIFALTATTMLCGGSVHESINAKARADGFAQNWYPHFVGWWTHAASWIVIFNYFFKTVSDGDAPGFVYAIVIVLFILDGTFALLFWLQWAKIGPFKDYVTGEKGFILLSFTAKALLAWINYGGGSR